MEREAGWYFVKKYPGTRWIPCEFGMYNENPTWFVPGHFEREGYFAIIGPKIEEPKEE